MAYDQEGQEVAKIQLGDFGLNYSKNPRKIPGSALIKANGIVFYDDTIRKEPGTTLLGQNTTAPTSFRQVKALVDWWSDAVTQQLVHLAGDGYVYATSVAAPSDVDAVKSSAAVAVGAPTGQFVTAGNEDASGARKLFLFSGSSPPVYFTGTSLTVNAITPPLDWSSNYPTFGVVHNDRVWAGGNLNDPSRIYSSLATDHKDFLASGTVHFGVGTGVGKRLWAGKSFRGILFLFKNPHGIYWLDDSDINSLGWGMRQLTDGLGVAPSPHAVLTVGGADEELDESLLFMAPNGHIHALIASTTGGIQTRPITPRMQLDSWIKENVNLAELGKMTSWWYAQESLAVFCVPAKGSSVANLKMMFDFKRMVETGMPRFSHSSRDTVYSACIRQTPTTSVEVPLFGDDLGNIKIMEEETRGNAGAGYTGNAQTPHDDFSEADPELAKYRKIYDWFELEYIPTNPSTLSVSVYVDGSKRGATISLSLVGAGNVLGGGAGSFTFGTDTLAGETLVTMRRKLNVGDGRRISFDFSNSTLEEDFNLCNLYVGFRKGGEASR